MCMQEKIELSSMSLRPRLSSTKISGDLSLNYKDIATIKIVKKFPGVAKKLACCCLGAARATPCDPMATGLLLLAEIVAEDFSLIFCIF